MHEHLRKEIEIYQRRTPKSAAAHQHNLQRLPLGVASNYRADAQSQQAPASPK